MKSRINELMDIQDFMRKDRKSKTNKSRWSPVIIHYEENGLIKEIIIDLSYSDIMYILSSKIKEAR